MAKKKLAAAGAAWGMYSPCDLGHADVRNPRLKHVEAGTIVVLKAYPPEAVQKLWLTAATLRELLDRSEEKLRKYPAELAAGYKRTRDCAFRRLIRRGFEEELVAAVGSLGRWWAVAGVPSAPIPDYSPPGA